MRLQPMPTKDQDQLLGCSFSVMDCTLSPFHTHSTSVNAQLLHVPHRHLYGYSLSPQRPQKE